MCKQSLYWGRLILSPGRPSVRLELYNNEVTDVLHVAQPKLPTTGRIVLFVIMSLSIKVRNCTKYCMDKDCLQGCLPVMGSTSVSTQNYISWCDLFIYSSRRMPSFLSWYIWVSHWYCLLHIQSGVSWELFHCLGDLLYSHFVMWLQRSHQCGVNICLLHCWRLVVLRDMTDQLSVSHSSGLESYILPFCRIRGAASDRAGEHNTVDFPKCDLNTRSQCSSGRRQYTHSQSAVSI
jgi:hypothetical protein